MSCVLFLLSGDPALIISQNNLPEKTKIIPFSEKQILTFGKTLSLLKQTNSSEVVFGMKSLDLQRYHQILKFMMLFSGISKGSLVDENGRASQYSRVQTVCLESLRLAFEVFASAGIVIQAWFVLRLRGWSK